MSLLWADNGDAISQQYAGTSALKGDFTRTGERNFLHAMKDGMKSANRLFKLFELFYFYLWKLLIKLFSKKKLYRYYLRFKDTYRQLAFEVLQGFQITDETSSLRASNSSANLADKSQKVDETSTCFVQDETSQIEREQNVRQLVSDCRKQLVSDNEDCYGSWALINYTE